MEIRTLESSRTATTPPRVGGTAWETHPGPGPTAFPSFQKGTLSPFPMDVPSGCPPRIQPPPKEAEAPRPRSRRNSLLEGMSKRRSLRRHGRGHAGARDRGGHRLLRVRGIACEDRMRTQEGFERWAAKENPS